jgi:hypothetical protein
MGKCAWCGAYIADSADKQALKSFGSMTGLDILSPLGRKLVPQYCSKQCKQAAAQAKGGGGMGGLMGNAGADSAEKAKVEADLDRDRWANEEARQARENADKDANIQQIMGFTFDGDAGSIVKDLSSLLTLVDANKPPSAFGSAPSSERRAKQAVYQAGLEKMEFGVLQLRSKGDMANAEYFQKKVEERKTSGLGKAAKGLGQAGGFMGNLLKKK